MKDDIPLVAFTGFSTSSILDGLPFSSCEIVSVASETGFNSDVPVDEMGLL